MRWSSPVRRHGFILIIVRRHGFILFIISRHGFVLFIAEQQKSWLCCFLLFSFKCVYPAAELLTAGLLREQPAVVLLNPWIHAQAYRAASHRVCSPAPTIPLVCHMQQSSGRPPI